MSRSKQQIDSGVTTVLMEVLNVALRIVEARQVNTSDRPRQHPGIFSHQSKYNPWRAYVWDKALKKNIYLGAFPTVSKAKAAQTAYRKGQPVLGGTRSALRLVKRAA